MKNDIYDKFNKLKELTKMVKEEHCLNAPKLDLKVILHKYTKIVFSGELAKEYGDYNAGYYAFLLRPQIDINLAYELKKKNPKIDLSREGIWHVQIYISTIDDGDLEAWSSLMTLEDANNLCDRIATEILEDLTTMPNSVDQLNLNFRPYGLFFSF